MKNLLLILFLSFPVCSGISGQAESKTVTGQVSFISSQNIYVRFGNTDGISVHDTLFISSGEKLIPVLVVTSISSSSCMCTAISREDLPVGHVIVAVKGPGEAATPVKTLEDVKKETPSPALPAETATSEKPAAQGEKVKPAWTKGNVNGSISAASYSDFSNSAGPDIQSFRYTLSLNAMNISDSKFSVESYISFRHKAGNWAEVSKNIFNALKIYSLALRYDIDSTSHLSLGRKINPRISGMGSFDGLEYEKSVKRFTFGAIAGSRPDYLNFGFDPKLLQFGAYVAWDLMSENAWSGTSLAFINQLFSGKTDRRFLYFQHSGSLMKNLSYFGSLETDIFKLVNDKPVTSFDLTSLYLSLNYRLSGRLSIGGSYDTRKNPVYYETFKSTLDTLIDNSLRQSYRLNSSFRITKWLIFGLQSSWRYLKSDPHQSKNVSGFLTYSHAGNNYFSATLSGSYISTGFINGYNSGISLTNSMLAGKIQTGVGYNYQDYRLPESLQNIVQHTGRADIYWQAAKKLSLSLNYEVTKETRTTYNRLYLQVRRRF